jgi:drug/metabolite transporter (DMT)-like permease
MWLGPGGTIRAIQAHPPRVENPPLAMAIGALGVSTSAIFIDLSGASPGTATFFRCALAVPLLLPLVIWERHREGPPTRRQCGYAVAAGVFFAGDALWWTQAIGEVGAGLSTVLVNAQVVLVPLLGLILDREPISRRFMKVLPVMIAGIVLTGGVLEAGTGGSDPVAGTVHAVLAAVCYSGFLYLLRRGGGRGSVIQNYLVVVGTAAGVALCVGPIWGSMTLTPGLEELAWLVLIAAAGQVAGWLLVALSAPHLRSEVGAAILLLTPIGALLLAGLVLDERPSALQLLGCALVLASAYAAAVRRAQQ